MSNPLRRNTAWQLLQTVAGTGVELVVLLTLAAVNSPSAFGAVAVALSATKLVYLLFEPRIHEFLTPKLARYLDRSRQGSWMWVVWSRKVELTLNGVAFAASLVLAYVVSLVDHGLSPALFAVCGLYNGCNTVLKFSSLAIFRCVDEVRIAALVSAGSALGKLCILGAAVAMQASNVSILIGLSATALLAGIVQATLAKEQLVRRSGPPRRFRGLTLRPQNRKRQGRLLWSNYGNGLVEILHRELDVQIAAWFAGPSEAGRYRIAKTFAMVMLEALSPVIMILLPYLARSLATHSRPVVVGFLRRISFALGGIGLLAGLVLLAGAGIYLSYFAPSQREAWKPILVLVPLFAMAAPGMWSQVYLVAAGRPHLYLRASMVGAICACALGVVLAPRLGAVGSALAHGIGLAMTTGLALMAAVKLLGELPARPPSPPRTHVS